MSSTESHTVVVETPARLHLGMLDVRGNLGRRFGGLGAAISHPSLCVEVSAAPPKAPVAAEGPDADRAISFARRFLSHHGINSGAHVTVHQTIPAHAGLGSGTQLGLAIARALAELYELPIEPARLARGVRAGRRSAVGTWTFTHGGLVVEGGKRPGKDAKEWLAPLIARLSVPEHWRCVVAVPFGESRLNGRGEEAALERILPPPSAEVHDVGHLLVMQLLPAVAEGDLRTFGTALTAVQRLTLGWFAAEQATRDMYATTLTKQAIAAMASHGAPAVGQSSWGPAAFGIVEGETAARELATVARKILGAQGFVYVGEFAQTGAQVRRGERVDVAATPTAAHGAH